MPKHHYVPQFYWKRFGNGKYVSAILMDYNFRFVERLAYETSRVSRTTMSYQRSNVSTV